MYTYLIKEVLFNGVKHYNKQSCTEKLSFITIVRYLMIHPNKHAVGIVDIKKKKK